jgi:toxin ParE1/3/4
MSRTIHRRPLARLDILELADYISRDSLIQAERFIDAVEASLQRLLDFPELGAAWDYRTRFKGLRVLGVHGFPNHLIFYRVRPDEIEVIRVCHGARDLKTLLG